ncbi:MAG TPA: thioredoxin family protein [Humisphaera sp.]|jgi:thiol:disulfide interchange protein|nr:thioredoxin family protein [Humisphaera sp.]
MVRRLRPAFFVLCALAAVGAASIVSRNGGATERIPWQQDLAAAKAQASASHKPVLVYFSARWCGFCEQMRKTTWSDERVESAMQNVVPVKIDVDEHQPLAIQYQVHGLPGYALLDENGTVIKRGEGWQEPGDFLNWLGQPR